jgi:hypothetical protein
MDEDLKEIIALTEKVKELALRLKGKHPDWMILAVEQLANNIQFLINNIEIAENNDSERW